MGSKEDRPVWARALTSIASLMLVGSFIFVLIAGFNLYITSALVTGAMGLAIPSAISAEGILDAVIGFFEALVEGVMEALFGIFEATTSLFG